MANVTNNEQQEIEMNKDRLFREEVFTDRKTGSLKILTPVDRNGQIDKTREIVYVGEAQLMTPMGAMPLTFIIDADSLGGAATKFAEAAKIAVDKAAKEIQELRREAASSIVIPEGMPQGGSPGGGMLGGGKIKMP